MAKSALMLSLHVVCVTVCLILAQTAHGEDVDKRPAPSDRERRSTAIALNYCRASFHRIRRYPSKRVLMEERDKILNNLNLNGIEDPEVIKLYTAVLDEIGDIEIAEQEQTVLNQKYREQFHRRLGTNIFVFGTELATAQFASAARTGANSWWDFREMGWNRELDTWKVEKNRMTSVVGKTTQILDTFWKVAKKKNIPDEWLVRGNDLDRLEEALKEPDPEVRLRIMKRMERFMECYPPYWYHVARTQQARGQLFAAADTYQKLAESGEGHFRQDDMLAAGLANRAVIQEYLAQKDAPETARKALTYSTAVWEANLLCAHVLGRHQRFDDAEEAVLRNLDVDLERDQSLVALLSVYVEARNEPKLQRYLNDMAVVQSVPVPVLLRCAAFLGGDRLPEPVVRHLAMSLKGEPQLRFGRDDFVLTADPMWRLAEANISMELGGQRYLRPFLVPSPSDHCTQAVFPKILDLGHPLASRTSDMKVTLHLKYETVPEIHIQMQRGGQISVATGRPDGSQAPLHVVYSPARRDDTDLRMTNFQFDETLVSLLPSNAGDTESQVGPETVESQTASVSEPVPVRLISQPDVHTVANPASEPVHDPLIQDDANTCGSDCDATVAGERQ